MKAPGIVTGAFALAVIVGVMVMLLKSPNKTTTLFGATASTISGITKGLEGR